MSLRASGDGIGCTKLPDTKTMEEVSVMLAMRRCSMCLRCGEGSEAALLHPCIAIGSIACVQLIASRLMSDCV